MWFVFLLLLFLLVSPGLYCLFYAVILFSPFARVCLCLVCMLCPYLAQSWSVFCAVQCQPHRRGDLFIEFDIRFPCTKLADQHKAAILQLLPALDALQLTQTQTPAQRERDAQAQREPCSSSVAASVPPCTGLPFSPSLPSSLSALSVSAPGSGPQSSFKNPFAIDSSPATGCFGSSAMPLSPPSRSFSASQLPFSHGTR